MSLDEDLYDLCANLQFDVAECFLQNVHNMHQGYVNPRSPLYSKFGQRTVIVYLESNLNMLLEQLQNDPTLQIIDENVFESKIGEILQESNWYTEGHAVFYQTCAKVILFSYYASEQGFPIEEKLPEILANFALKAHFAMYLDKNYDRIRYDMQSIFCTVFRLLGVDMRQHANAVDQEIGWEEYIFSRHHLVFINRTKADTFDRYRSISTQEFFMKTDKFEDITKIIINDFGDNDTFKRRFNKDNFITLAISITFLSFHCFRVGYVAGIQKGIDSIIKLHLLEERENFVTRMTSEYCDKMNKGTKRKLES